MIDPETTALEIQADQRAVPRSRHGFQTVRQSVGVDEQQEDGVAKVLVVDDVRSQVELICQALQSGGLATTIAYSGKEALALLMDTPPDLVLLDVLMPDMNGYEVLRKIRKNKATRQLPVVMLTTKTAEHDKVWGLEMGADAYLTKPFETQHLVSVIRRLLWDQQESSP